MNKQAKKGITPKEEDYSRWYQDIISQAELAENGPVRGTMIMKPYGYALWEGIQKELDKRFKEIGVENAYFPLFIPEKFLKKEADHIEGFAPEVAVVTYAGGKELEEPVIVRPTSETIIYDAFSRWIQSYRDLPLLINQWANVVRWELRPRLFLRTTEFLWQEGHTAHKTQQEADEFARKMLEVYKDFMESVLAIETVAGEKSESEKFAGAHKTYTLEAMMQDGKALQIATSHNLGDNFARAFNVTFLDENGSHQYVYQTSWGVSTRTIGGLIMSHSDNVGLVLPPKIAPIQVIITTIGVQDLDKIFDNSDKLKKSLEKENIRCKIDKDNISPGQKFYKWERKGVPVRIEIGPKELQEGVAVLVRRDTGEKIRVSFENVACKVKELLDEIQSSLLKKSKERLKNKTKYVDTWEDFKKEIENGNFVMAHWSGNVEVEKQIKEETGATIRCIPFDEKEESGKCVKSGKPSSKRVLFAKAY